MEIINSDINAAASALIAGDKLYKLEFDLLERYPKPEVNKILFEAKNIFYDKKIKKEIIVIMIGLGLGLTAYFFGNQINEYFGFRKKEPDNFKIALFFFIIFRSIYIMLKTFKLKNSNTLD